MNKLLKKNTVYSTVEFIRKIKMCSCGRVTNFILIDIDNTRILLSILGYQYFRSAIDSFSNHLEKLLLQICSNKFIILQSSLDEFTIAICDTADMVEIQSLLESASSDLKKHFLKYMPPCVWKFGKQLDSLITFSSVIINSEYIFSESEISLTYLRQTIACASAKLFEIKKEVKNTHSFTQLKNRIELPHNVVWDRFNNLENFCIPRNFFSFSYEDFCALNYDSAYLLAPYFTAYKGEKGAYPLRQLGLVGKAAIINRRNGEHFTFNIIIELFSYYLSNILKQKFNMSCIICFPGIMVLSYNTLQKGDFKLLADALNICVDNFNDTFFDNPLAAINVNVLNSCYASPSFLFSRTGDILNYLKEEPQQERNIFFQTIDEKDLEEIERFQNEEKRHQLSNIKIDS